MVQQIRPGACKLANQEPVSASCHLQSRIGWSEAFHLQKRKPVQEEKREMTYLLDFYLTLCRFIVPQLYEIKSFSVLYSLAQTGALGRKIKLILIKSLHTENRAKWGKKQRDETVSEGPFISDKTLNTSGCDIFSYCLSNNGWRLNNKQGSYISSDNFIM